MELQCTILTKKKSKVIPQNQSCEHQERQKFPLRTNQSSVQRESTPSANYLHHPNPYPPSLSFKSTS
ncbi:hypothetical protein Hanom_Chr14g01265461 [Helianthus anomalus]